MEDLDTLLTRPVAVHDHPCTGKVLGVRMAMRACKELGVAGPLRDNKRLVVFVEIVRCGEGANDAHVVRVGNLVLCRGCANGRYYHLS
jgi:formylmethanofuran dehydrogenase subunit E